MNYDLNKLLKFAQDNGVSINIEYSESSDELTIETVSPAPIECLYMKRCSDIDYFITQWNLQIKGVT